MSVVAHFFMSVGGSEIHERLAHFFIDFYTFITIEMPQREPNIRFPLFFSKRTFQIKNRFCP